MTKENKKTLYVALILLIPVSFAFFYGLFLHDYLETSKRKQTAAKYSAYIKQITQEAGITESDLLFPPSLPSGGWRCEITFPVSENQKQQLFTSEKVLYIPKHCNSRGSRFVINFSLNKSSAWKVKPAVTIETQYQDNQNKIAFCEISDLIKKEYKISGPIENRKQPMWLQPYIRLQLSSSQNKPHLSAIKLSNLKIALMTFDTNLYGGLAYSTRTISFKDTELKILF